MADPWVRVMPCQGNLRGANRDARIRKETGTQSDWVSPDGNVGGETAKSCLGARANQEICFHVEILARWLA